MHIKNSLKVALAVMKSKIISSEKDSVGIILFGVVSHLVPFHISYIIIMILF
jgi:hypothetical protein